MKKPYNYYDAHPEARVIEAAEVANQRLVNRQNGARIDVDWVPGDWLVDIHAKWIKDHDKAVNVFVNEVE